MVVYSCTVRKSLLPNILRLQFNEDKIEGEIPPVNDKFNSCEFCSLFTQSSDSRVIGDNCVWETSLSDTFCSKNDKGPYAVINPLWGGLHNVWLAIFSGLYFSQAWNETGSTIVLSGNVATRKAFSKEQYAKFYPLEISDVFDTMHIQAYMKKRFGVNLCIAKHDKNRDPSDFPSGIATYDELKRFSGLNESHFISFNSSIHDIPGSNASEILKMVPKHSNVVLYSIHSWTTHFRYSPPSLDNYDDFHIKEMRNAALALCYSKPVRDLSAILLSEMYRYLEAEKIIGLHLRLEGDWTHDSWSEEQSMGVLKEYEQEILSYKTWTGRNVSIYIAHGSLSPDMEIIVNKWVSNLNLQVFQKESIIGKMLGRRDLQEMTPEVQAAVDAETLVHLDHFIGYCASSMSYVIQERRKYLGNTNYIVEPSFQPGYDFWYPIFVPKNHKYFKENRSPKVEK